MEKKTGKVERFKPVSAVMRVFHASNLRNRKLEKLQGSNQLQSQNQLLILWENEKNQSGIPPLRFFPYETTTSSSSSDQKTT